MNFLHIITPSTFNDQQKMFLIQRNWLKVEQSDKLTRRRQSSFDGSKSSVTTRSLISQKNGILGNLSKTF